MTREMDCGVHSQGLDPINRILGVPRDEVLPEACQDAW